MRKERRERCKDKEGGMDAYTSDFEASNNVIL